MHEIHSTTEMTETRFSQVWAIGYSKHERRDQSAARNKKSQVRTVSETCQGCPAPRPGPNYVRGLPPGLPAHVSRGKASLSTMAERLKSFDLGAKTGPAFTKLRRGAVREIYGCRMGWSKCDSERATKEGTL